MAVIDSVLSDNMIRNYKLNKYVNVIGEDTKKDITHGAKMLEIAKKEISLNEVIYIAALDEEAGGTQDDITKAIEIAIDENVEVISLSLATREKNKKLEKEVKRAIKKGIKVVSACMNYSNEECYPAMYKGVISVSEGMNKEAKVKLGYKTFELEMGDKKIKEKSTSASTIYVSSQIVKTLKNGNNYLNELINDLSDY